MEHALQVLRTSIRNILSVTPTECRLSLLQIIALHTFCVLFLRLPLKRVAMWGTLIGTWSAIIAVVIAGPATMDTEHRGPFCK